MLASFAALACLSIASAQEIQFWVRPKGDDHCRVGNGTMNCSDSNGATWGGCMYNPATTLIYCCIPGDELAGCWTYESPCSHGQNPRKPGDNQTKCTDQIMTDNDWCCDKVQEECPLNFRNNGICLINSVANPLRSEDATVWSDIKNRTFLGPLGVTTTTSMASTLSASVSESTGSVHTTQLAPSSSLGIHSTPAPISSGTGSGKVSAGAIAGAAIGALMGVGLAVVGVIFLTRRYTKKVVAAELEKLHNDGKQKPEVEEQQVGWRDNIWRAELEAKGGGMRQSERDDEAADLQQSEHEGKVEELRWVGGELDEEHAKVKRG